MADYTSSKSGPGGVFPASATESVWPKAEPLITPEQLRNRFLFGIPLVSNIKDPRTGKAQAIDDTQLKDFIETAVAEVETEVGIDIFPMKIEEKHPYDQFEYQSFGYFRIRRRPAASVESLTVNTATNLDVFTVPIEWIDTAYLSQGQINIVPLVSALGQTGIVPASSAGGAVFLQIMGSRPWIPSFWKISYTTGFPDGKLPRIVNEMIGAVASISILSQLAATFARSNSYSLSVDSLSQSISTPGPAIFQQRITDLTDKRKMLKGKLKAMFGLKLFSGNV